MHRRHEGECTVAIKKIHKSFYGDHAASTDDLRLWDDDEVRFLMVLRHERLVSFFGAGECDEFRFIVTELMSGGSIERKLWGTAVSSLTNRSRLVWALDVARGMSFIHSRGYVHRDLKTPNILYDASTGRAKVADMGLGKFVTGSGLVVEAQSISPHDTVSKEKEIARSGRSRETFWEQAIMTSNAGSLSWMAPEVMRKFAGEIAKYSAAIDVYAYGIVLWELMAHKQPWVDDPVLEEGNRDDDDSRRSVGTEIIFEVVRAGKRPTINAEMRSLIGSDYVSFVEQCWRQKPRERPSFDVITTTVDNLLKRCEVKEKNRRRSLRAASAASKTGSKRNSLKSRGVRRSSKKADFVNLDIEDKSN
eukprot:g1202.t1